MTMLKPSDLPNQTNLIAPENLEFIRKVQETASSSAKVSNKRKAKADEDDGSDVEIVHSKSAKKTKASAETPTDLFSVHLDGEEDGAVPVYDSCDELRRKITIYLAQPGVTKTQFLRDIVQAASTPANSFKLQTKQLSDFQALRGATGGCSSRVCYASYVYFEKKRIAEGEPKSKHRLGMEETWGAAGLPKEIRRGGWCGPGERITEDKYGKVKVVRR